MSPEEIVLDEFGCHYLGDELRVGPDFVARVVPDMARDSAERMLSVLGTQDRAPLIALLRRLRDNRADPLHRTIGEQTLLWWADSDKNFVAFRALVDAMIKELEQ